MRERGVGTLRLRSSHVGTHKGLPSPLDKRNSDKSRVELCVIYPPGDSYSSQLDACDTERHGSYLGVEEIVTRRVAR